MLLMKITKNQPVLEYLQTLGLRPAKNIDNFWRDLNRKYSKSIICELENTVESRADGNPGTGLYELKNKSLPLSLDFSTWSADLYRRFFDWLLAANITMPTRVLDIGCDNGIVTCFLAKYYPDSEFLGIDLSENSIQVARELAIKLGLKNVTFQRMNAFEVHNAYSNYFDMVISVRSLHEILGGFTALRSWSIQDLENNKIVKEQIGELAKILNALVTGGQLVAFERLLSDVDVASFIKMLNLSGLRLNESISSMIPFHEVGDQETMPVLVFEKKADTIYADDLQRAICNICKKDLPLLECGTAYEGFLAENLVEQLNDKNLLKGLNIIFHDGSGELRCELWQNENFILAYNHTNIGFRSLNILNKDVEDTAMEELEKVKDKYASYAACTYYNAQNEL